MSFYKLDLRYGEDESNLLLVVFPLGEHDEKICTSQ